MVSTEGLTKKEVFIALYNRAHPQGMGFLRATPGDMSEDEAEQYVGGEKTDDNKSRPLYFDYVNGRVMKVDLRGDDGFEERLYDRDNGTGAALHAIEEARRQKTSGAA